MSRRVRLCAGARPAAATAAPCAAGVSLKPASTASGPSRSVPVRRGQSPGRLAAPSANLVPRLGAALPPPLRLLPPPVGTATISYGKHQQPASQPSERRAEASTPAAESQTAHVGMYSGEINGRTTWPVHTARRFYPTTGAVGTWLTGGPDCRQLGQGDIESPQPLPPLAVVSSRL